MVEQRAHVTQELSALGCEVYPSQANFILVRPPELAATAKTGGPARPFARAVYEALKQKGIFVRYLDQDRLDDKLRITIGTPQQNDALLAAMAQSFADCIG